MLIITRKKEFRDYFRAYKVILDDKEIGKIKSGETKKFELPKGVHQLHLKIDWCTSSTVEFSSSQEDLEFECGNSLKGLKILRASTAVFTESDSYLWLKKMD